MSPLTDRIDRPLVLVGNGGHARVIRSVLVAQRQRIAGYVAPEPSNSELKWLGDDDAFLTTGAICDRANVGVVLAVGSTRSTSFRRDLFQRYLAAGWTLEGLQAVSAIVSDGADLGKTSQLLHGCVIQAEVTLGDNVIINTGAIVEHDCVVGSHTHVATGAILCGGVHVGECCHIGAGATVVQGVTLGDQVTVGAGAVVLNDVPDNATVVGVPAQEIS